MGYPRLDPLNSPRRRRVVDAIARLTVDLRRAPTAADVARWCGMDKKGVMRAVAELRRLGMIEWTRMAIHYKPQPLRLTARCRVQLGLPIIAYIAWPLPSPSSEPDAHAGALEVGRAFANWVTCAIAGCVPVSPYLAEHDASTRPRFDAAAVSIAALADVAIVYRDPLVAGRADVVAAVNAKLPITVIDRAGQDAITAGADPWSPPWRQSYPQTRSDS